MVLDMPLCANNGVISEIWLPSKFKFMRDVRSCSGEISTIRLLPIDNSLRLTKFFKADMSDILVFKKI